MTGSSGQIKRAILFINLHKGQAKTIAAGIREVLESRGTRTDFYTFEKKSLSFEGEGCDIAFSLGGDGTVLYAARSMADLGVPIVPVNLGTLGFIASVSPGEWEAVYDAWLAGTIVPSRRFMLEAAVERQGRRIFVDSCLNDVVISASGIAKLIRLQVKSDYVSLGEYRSDGLIIATPTGSTGYSAAAGGPILDPEIEAIIVNPICPFTLSNRPIVLPPDEAVTITVEREQRSGVLLTVDGQVTEALEPGDCICIRKASHYAELVASDRNAFYKALRSKLNWLGTTGSAGGETGVNHA
ncbi:MAG: NAD(+)/NADH kinase [Treponema sp.]|jgi:NAD+ kinase|nr:NAD(+)/NADH kinase [Treponema sp.]